MGHIMQARLPLTEERKTSMVRRERIWTFKAASFFRHELPEVQVLLGPSHRVGVSASGVGQSKQVQQPIADQPRQPDYFVCRLVTFEQEGRSPVVTNQPGNFFTSLQITPEITQHSTGNVFSFDGVFGGADSARLGINFSGQGLGNIMEQSSEYQKDEVRGLKDESLIAVWTCLSAFLLHPSYFRKNHLRVGPDISFRMPLGILCAVRHRLTPWLGFGPSRDVFQRRLFELLPVHNQISTASAS